MKHVNPFDRLVKEDDLGKTWLFSGIQNLHQCGNRDNSSCAV